MPPDQGDLVPFPDFGGDQMMLSVAQIPTSPRFVPLAAAGGIDKIANGYLCSFRLASHGWELLRDRSSRRRTIR